MSPSAQTRAISMASQRDPSKEPEGVSEARRARRGAVADVLALAPRPGLSLEDLVTRAQAGDRWATDALFRRYAPPLTRFITRVMARTGDADDVVQDALADALAQLPRLRDPARFEAWLYRIALNRARKRLRRRKLTRAIGLDRGLDDATLGQLAAPTVDPETIAELQRVDVLLKKLPYEVRAAWVLRFVEGETLERVAALTGSSLATAKRRVSAGRAAVQAHLRGCR